MSARQRLAHGMVRPRPVPDQTARPSHPPPSGTSTTEQLTASPPPPFFWPEKHPASHPSTLSHSVVVHFFPLFPPPLPGFPCAALVLLPLHELPFARLRSRVLRIRTEASTLRCLRDSPWSACAVSVCTHRRCNHNPGSELVVSLSLFAPLHPEIKAGPPGRFRNFVAGRLKIST